jgi:hypothetical protein
LEQLPIIVSFQNLPPFARQSAQDA